LTIAGAPVVVSRSGYSGEDGYEISMPPTPTASPGCFWRMTRSRRSGSAHGIRCGLRPGSAFMATTSIETTTPVEANLKWAIQKPRRTGGEREGGFPGADVILKQFDTGPERLRVGLKPSGKAPVRAGAVLYERENGGEAIGTVTSGGFGPSAGGPGGDGLCAHRPVGNRHHTLCRSARQAA
jgi:aminomethyltransferase